MKPVGPLSLGLAAAIAIIFWMRERAHGDQPAFANASSRRLPDRSAAQVRDGSRGRPPDSSVERIARNPLDDALASIRSKLRRLNETEIGDKEKQDELLTGLVAILTDANAAEITQSLTTDELGSPFGLAALQHWLKVDADSAASWVAARTDATDEQAWAVARALVADRVALDSFCSRLPDNPWRQVFLKQAVREAMWQDPAEAIRVAQRMNTGGEQTDLLQTTACAWMISDPAAASDWITHVQDLLLRERLVCAGAETQAGTDPLRAIEWLISSVAVPSEASEALVNQTIRDIFETWAENAPAQAAGMVALFPRGDLREVTAGVVSQRWLQRDPAAAGDWIRNLPERERMQSLSGKN